MASPTDMHGRRGADLAFDETLFSMKEVIAPMMWIAKKRTKRKYLEKASSHMAFFDRAVYLHSSCRDRTACQCCLV